MVSAFLVLTVGYASVADGSLQAATIGTTASIVNLAGATIIGIQEIRKAQRKFRGTSKALGDISKQLSALEASLELVMEESGLQTAGVEMQMKVVGDVAAELKLFFDRLTALQQRRTVTQFFHMLASGDADDHELQGILDRLDRANQDLGLRISVAQVGLLGDLQDGFRVAHGVLMQTNGRVRDVLGMNLALMDRLRERPVASDGTIPLSADDMDGLEMPSARVAADEPAANDEAAQTDIHDNVTLGQSLITTGNVGVEAWHKAAARKTTIANNRFGADSRIMTGDLGGEAAARFNDSFWK